MPFLSKAWQGKLFLLAGLLQEKLGRLCFHKVLQHARCNRSEADMRRLERTQGPTQIAK